MYALSECLFNYVFFSDHCIRSLLSPVYLLHNVCKILHEKDKGGKAGFFDQTTDKVGRPEKEGKKDGCGACRSSSNSIFVKCGRMHKTS